MLKSPVIPLLLLAIAIHGAIGTLGCSAGHRSSAHGQRCQAIEHDTHISSIRFSNGGKYLFSQGDLDGQVIMWNLEMMQSEKVLVSPFQGIWIAGSVRNSSEFEVSPTGHLLAYTRGGDVYLYDYEKQRDVCILKREALVSDVHFIYNGKYISVDGIVWDIKERKKINEIATDVPWQISVVPKEEVVVFGCNKTVALYDIHTKEEILKIKTFKTDGHVGQALFTSDGKRGFALNEKGHLSYFNVETGEVVTSFQPWKKYKVGVEKIIIDESKGRLYGISMGYEKFTVSIFDLEKGDLLKTSQRDLPIPRE